MTTDRNWREVFSGAGQLPKDWLDTAQRWHRHFLLKAIPAILLTLVLGVGLNAAGWKEVNFLFALAAILGGLFFATQPKVVLAVFGVGALWNGLLDAKVTGAKANLDQGLQFVSDKYVRPVGHVLLLTTVVFVFLGTYRIQNPLAILPLIVVVMGLGLWAALFASDTTWYRRITLKLLLAAGVMSLIGAYFYTPSRTEKTVERIEAARETNRDKLVDEALTPILRKVEGGYKLSTEENELLRAAKEREERKSIVNKVRKFFTNGEQDVTIDSLSPVKICGLPNGSKKFVIDGGDPILVILIPDETKPTGMGATRTNTKGHPRMGIAVRSEENLVRNGGLVDFQGKDCSTLQLMVPPDTKRKLESGKFVLSPLTVRIRFE